MTNYDEQAEELRQKLYRLGAIVDVLPDKTSREAIHFTHQIEQLSIELVDLETMTPQMERADKELQRARADLARATNQTRAELHAWMNVTKGCGIVGVLGVLVSLVWLPTFWLPLLSAASLVGSVAAYWQRTRVEEFRTEELDAQQQQVDLAEDLRDRLRPGQRRPQFAAQPAPQTQTPTPAEPEAEPTGDVVPVPDLEYTPRELPAAD